MKYDILLFDVDNTLLDFDANEGEAFKSVVINRDEEYSEELFETYKTMNHQMWKDAELGKITVDELINTRFAKLMMKYGKEVDGAEWEKTYRGYLNEGFQEMPYVHEVLAELKKNYRLYVVTNGVEETQDSRMNGAHLKDYFEDIFVSETIGANKPSKEFFDYVKDHIDNFDSSKALVIGDSLTSDIKGGNMAEIDTCWYCKEGTENDTDIIPTYTIHGLKELITLLEQDIV